MKIAVVDGQGGGLGRSIVEALRRTWPEMEIAACGTNATATMAMLKAGASYGATGEHAIRHNVREAAVVLGAVGIAFVGSMHGEVSPAVALAVSGSAGQKVLIPVTKCRVSIAGQQEQPLAAYLADMVEKVRQIAAE